MLFAKDVNIIEDRKFKILLLIVDEYINTGNAISSDLLVNKYPNLNISSATIRNEMVKLENENYIEKAYKSSGRIPTNKGYKFYIENFAIDDYSLTNIRSKIDKIFSKRSENIEEMIEKALKIINKATNTFLISKDEDKDYLVEDLKLYKINEKRAMIVAVSSSGRLYNEELNIENFKFKDIENSFKIISQRLIGTKIKEVKEKSSLISELVIKKLQFVEKKFKLFIEKLIISLFPTEEKYYGINSLVNIPTLREKEQFEKVFEMVEDKTIWDLLDSHSGTLIKNQEKNLTISFDFNQLKDISIINKILKLNNNSWKKITIIGPKNQDYKKIITMINLLDENIDENIND
ncbi:MAG: heat-inducible transcription repressor HrcA [Candidatus Hepatoplasma crinochetorum]|nr:MAG: heat-inducible transcription repressor HrcA [Candidatus Hepatoplasma crinochetorum]